MTISLFGSAPGVAAGTAIGAAAALGQEVVPLVIPWDRTAFFFLASAAIGVLALLWPGCQAARLPMLEAIGADTE
ncbi:hypothetical protein [Streptomyces asiaticus]|uniref:hypothetical protein n=1 Tax=Streptomyces asiaticus TaxID=114695 RepID=UPI003803A227